MFHSKLNRKSTEKREENEKNKIKMKTNKNGTKTEERDEHSIDSLLPLHPLSFQLE